jgi:hypothetical protein
MILALLITSCGSSRKLMESAKEVRDSVVIREIQTVINVPVPESKVELVIPTENLHNLPPGAVYADKNGQANVRVTTRNDTIYVSASCDSLSLQCERYEKELVRIRNDTEKQLTEVKKNGFQTLFKWCSIGFCAGVVLTFIVIIILKRKKIW